MPVNKVTIEPESTRQIYLSLRDGNPPVSISVIAGNIKVALLGLDSQNPKADKKILALNVGESAVVCAASVRISNISSVDAKCEINVGGK